MAELIHYTNPQSRGMRTQVLLKTFGIPHREEVIEFSKGETRTESYLAIHPYGRVPALRDGDVTVVESGAITLYLADKFADQMGAPAAGSPERALLYEWLFFFQATLEPLAIQSFAAEDKSELRGQVKTLLEAMAPRLRGPFALGQEFTMLDVVIGVELYWYKLMGLFPEELSVYEEYLARVTPKFEMG